MRAIFAAAILGCFLFAGFAHAGEVSFGLIEPPNLELEGIPTIGHLNREIRKDILGILRNGSLDKILGDCKEETKADALKVTYWLVSEFGTLIPFKTYIQLNRKLPVVFLVHGWGGNKNVDYIEVMWRAYYNAKVPVNVIVVDYGFYVGQGYFAGVCNLPRVAVNFAKRICGLKYELFMNLERDVHIVGHSLGSHVSGLTGRDVQRNGCGKIARITGLDPAGPFFHEEFAHLRIARSDAKFVDIVHTNMKAYGYYGALGDVDFYPNCGFLQPGCAPHLKDIIHEDLAKLTLSYITCNHQRSCFLYAESVTHNKAFNGVPCPLCRESKCPPITLLHHSDDAYMGSNCTQMTPEKEYYVFTRGMAPYGNILTEM